MRVQLGFDLPLATRFGAADFLVSACNRDAFERLAGGPDWPMQGLALHGPAGSGKTHLAHLWCGRTGATLILGAQLGDVGGLTAGDIAVDGIEEAPEEPLLHLYNSALERRARLLLTMRLPPAALRIALPDLASRLRALPVAGIGPPDDALLAAVLVKQFADRQIEVRPEVIVYLVARIERSFAGAASAAAQLDAAALAAGRPITVKLARAVLGL
jgi:chromosomal replication initiation ATPase DnaA